MARTILLLTILVSFILFLRLKFHLDTIGLGSKKGPEPLAGEIMALTRRQDLNTPNLLVK
jgi:hypothetical protein